MPLGPVQSSSVKVVQIAINRLEAAFTKATPFVDKDRGRQNVKSALQLALGHLKGLHEKLEIHLITALSLAEIDVLLSRAKTNVVNVAGLKSVNIISPLTERPAEEGEEESGSTVIKCLKTHWNDLSFLNETEQSCAGAELLRSSLRQVVLRLSGPRQSSEVSPAESARPTGGHQAGAP